MKNEYPGYTAAELKQTGVYCIRNTVNGKRYVGSASISFLKRWGEHMKRIRSGSHPNRHLQAAWSQYGDSSFIFDILEVCKPEYAVAFEQVYLEFYKSADPSFGYNICVTAGSQRGMKRSEDTKALLSSLSKARTTTPEAKAAQSAITTARFASKEAREAQSERTKRQFASAEARAANSKRQREIHGTPEMRAKHSAIAAARSGTPQAREAARIRMKNKFADADFLAEHSARTKISHGTPEFRAATSERMKAYYADPANRAANVERQRQLQGTPEARAARSAQMKAIYADPVRKAAADAKRNATISLKKLAMGADVVIATTSTVPSQLLLPFD